MIIAFCGHANYIENEEDEQKVLLLLEKRVNDEGCELFLGEYGGFDSFAYRCAKKHKEAHPQSRMIFVTPYLSPEYRKNSIEYTKHRFDQVIYPPLENVPPRYAIVRQNRWIVEQADVIIAYITHKYGGAYKMYQYAKKKDKEVYNIANVELG
ncbi:MAG: hypothetical protein E7609_03850 [Ruminococcaceae bacterium]|nr:hypothetical protein [Oscillospiraceae bacterium]